MSGARPRVVVLSFNNLGNFGDRLGYHLLNHILPPHANVVYSHFSPWDVPDGPIDLLIVGIGNSLFEKIVTDRLLELVARAPRAIGIFGTQYRAMLNRVRLGQLIDRLEMWYARHQDDVACFGANRTNVCHLGDWLINAFPMTEPTSSKALRLGPEVMKDLPMDRIIQLIQKHRVVFSPRLHPLLCALTSAEQVAYLEQRDYGGDLVSGKFASMFRDIFGQTYPEKALIDVNKAAVLRYKTQVHLRMDSLREHLRKLLGSPGREKTQA